MQLINSVHSYLPVEMETSYVHVKTCIWRFLATSFKIAKNWSHTKSPPVDKRINKFWYIHITEYNSTKQK